VHIFATPEFWVAASFVGFLALMIYFGIPGKIAELLDKRAEAIRAELDEARRLREEAQAILAEYERKQRGADKEAEAIIKLAQEEAEALAAETRRKMKETIERRTRQAEEKIALAEQQAMLEVRAAAVDVAVKAAEKIIEKKMTPAASAKLIDQSIKGLKSKLN